MNKILIYLIFLHNSFLVSYKELCPKGEGFEKNGEDMNECKVAGICKNGRCINTPGAYKCECNAGFDMDETGTMCVDINECEISKSICGRGQCINTYGSFRCRCESGFRNDMMMEMCVGKYDKREKKE